MNRVMIAGTHSGVGKTTISIGVMAALKSRGLKVAPFKTGPDYIDPGFHKYVTGNSSYNLDSYLLPEQQINYLLHKGMVDRDIGVIEGVMGLYDGFGISSEIGSSADISMITKTPIILVIDGRGISNSAAAMVMGYKMYRNVNIKGIIINRVSSEKHYQLLKKIIETNTDIRCIGYLLKNIDLSLESRHLGLIPADELDHLNEKLDELVDLIEGSINVDELLKIAKIEGLQPYEQEINNFFINESKLKYKNKRIGIALDKAFSFYYQANLDILEELGAALIPFSPLHDSRIPDNLDSIYMGGGFPEVFSNNLQNNKSFRSSLRDYLDNNGKCYAECGGLMYLSQGIKNLDGTIYDMVGFLPFVCKMTKTLQRFGYVEVETSFGNKEYKTRAHEFHHSEIDNLDSTLDYKYNVFKYRDNSMINQWKCGIAKKNTLAGYPHLYFLSNLELMTKLLLDG